MNKLSYKDYYGSVEYSDEDEVLHGCLLNINDIVTYEGTTIAEIKANFAEAVEGYLRMCAELGQPPDKPASGKFNVRIDPNLHRKAQEKAAVLDVSLNDLVANALREYIEEHV
ncbi:MAG: type II toxin-antitoxin system HicB family antitoxin [Candidatus Nitrosoglobus sp.]|jgi:predicted HicB family RNase H-like nuclease